MKQGIPHIKDKLTSINTVDTDYRAEVVVAGLVENGYDADKLLIIRQKGDKRYVSKDINRAENEYSTQDLMEYLYIYTNRQGIYDTIPEGIFHQPLNTAKKKTQEDVLLEIRKHRDEEFFARRYFQPFEMVLDQILVDAQLFEGKFNKKNFHDDLKKIFTRYWSILKLLTLKQAVLFLKIIPVIHRVSTDLDVMGILVGAILEAPIKVEIGKKSKLTARATEDVQLGKWYLGITSILGDQFEDGYRNICITVGPVTPEQMKLFEVNFKNDLILKALLHMMIPSDCQIDIKYKTIQEHAKFSLSGGTHKAYLGINTIL